jgi:hypothetical protein
MAFIHTNFLTGNDTTGDGSTGTPYKTVFKALGVAASSDFIKVAGGQWSSTLSGDFTFTNGLNTVTTSVSQVGTVLVDDILSFEDGQFGFDKFHLKVTAVAAGTITLAVYWPGPTITTSTVKRIETYHYTTTGTTAFETWNTTAIQPTGRTGITISGGWSSDFTTQGGWTVIRRSGQAIGTVASNSPAGFNITATGGIGSWGQNLIFDKFLAHTAVMIQPLTTATAQSFAIGELAAVRGIPISNSSVTSGFGLWQADPAVSSKLYLTSPGLNTGIVRANTSYATNTSQPTIFNVDIYATLSGTAVNTAISQSAGIGSVAGDGGFQLASSKNKQNMYLRQTYIEPTFSGIQLFGYPVTSSPITSGAGTYVKNLYIYQNAPGTVFLSSGESKTIFENIEYLGAFASKTTLTFFNTGQVYVDLSAAAKTIDQFKPGTNSLGSYQGTYTETPFTSLMRAFPLVQVKDSEGLKTLDENNNIYFKTGGNLKISSGTSYTTNSSLFYAWKMIGVTDQPAVPFTVTFTLKVDTGKTAEWDKLAIQYGPLDSQIIEQALTPTDSFATYTMTVDPASYSDWSTYKSPIYFGIRSKTANVFDEETMSYCYIQSVTVA